MRSNQIVIRCTLLCSLAAVPRVAANDDDLIERCRKADSASAAYLANKDVFPNADSDQLRMLEQDHDLRIALRAAFETVHRSVTLVETPELRSPSKESLVHFIRFAERRLRIEVPSWWKNSLLKSRGHKVLMIPLPDARVLYRRVKAENLWVSKQLRVDSECDTVVLSIRNRKCRIPRKMLMEDDKEGVVGIDAIVHQDKCLVALLSWQGHQFSLHCMDLRSQRRVWKADVWATGPIVNYGGRPTQPALVELVLRDGEIFVFGAAIDGAYIEAFDVNSGDNTCRFSTSY